MSDGELLGIAIRARWLGFAQLDSQRRLIDWGMIFYQRKKPGELKAAKKRLEGLLARMTPSHVAYVLPRARANEEISRVRSITRALHAAASSRSIQIIALPRKMVRAAFVSCDAKVKGEIASLLAREFPEIAWKLPPKQKIGVKEDSRMALFDALAGAVAYHQHRLVTLPATNPRTIEPSGRPHGDV